MRPLQRGELTVYGAKPIQQSPVLFHPPPPSQRLRYRLLLYINNVNSSDWPPCEGFRRWKLMAERSIITSSVFWQRENEPAAGSGGDCAEESEIGGDGEWQRLSWLMSNANRHYYTAAEWRYFRVVDQLGVIQKCFRDCHQVLTPARRVAKLTLLMESRKNKLFWQRFWL